MTRDPNTGQFRSQSVENAPREREGWSPRYVANPSSSCRTGMNAALGMLGGAGLGAALMYLMDPNQGAERRHHLADIAGEAMESTSQALRTGAEHLGHKAADAGAALYAAVPSSKDIGHTGRLLGRRASEAAESTRQHAGDWLDSARGMFPHRQRQHEVSATTAGIGGVAALAIGLGAMWLFDPDRGRGRRAWIGQKMNRCVNETGKFMRATGRHLRNKSRGYYHEGKHLAESHLAGRGSVEPESSAQQRMNPSPGGVADSRVSSTYEGGSASL